MKRIKPSENEQHWPRHSVSSIECRKRDLIIRLADWSRDKDEPAFDVEVYIGGVYDWTESKSFTFSKEYGKFKNRTAAKTAAVAFAQAQTAKFA